MSPEVKSTHDRRQWRGGRWAGTKALGYFEWRAARSQRCDRRILWRASPKPPLQATADYGLEQYVYLCLVYRLGWPISTAKRWNGALSAERTGPWLHRGDSVISVGRFQAVLVGRLLIPPVRQSPQLLALRRSPRFAQDSPYF